MIDESPSFDDSPDPMVEDNSPSGLPILKMRYGRLRDGVLTTLSRVLSKTRRPLWYVETLALSARYQQWLRSCAWAHQSKLHRDRLHVWREAALPLVRKRPYSVLEFGVADGLATTWWANSGVDFAAWHGFDTFEGLPAAWGRAGVQVMAAGVFSPEAGRGKVPSITSHYPQTWHRGLIEETLPDFARPDGPLFVLIDVDLLGPTETVLMWLLENGQPGDLIYFDEAFDPWNEGLALRRALARGLSVLAIAHTGSSLLVQLGDS